MIVTYDPPGINNFHNQPAMRLRISGEKTGGYSGPVYTISKQQARKIQSHFCGVRDCGCPHGAVMDLYGTGSTWGIHPKFCA